MDINKIRTRFKEHISGNPRPLLWFAAQIGVNRMTLANFFFERNRTSYETATKVVDYLDSVLTERT